MAKRALTQEEQELDELAAVAYSTFFLAMGGYDSSGFQMPNWTTLKKDPSEKSTVLAWYMVVDKIKEEVLDNLPRPAAEE